MRKIASFVLSLKTSHQSCRGFPAGAGGREPSCQCRRLKRCGLDPWIGKIPWRANGKPLQYSCLKIPWTEKLGGLQSDGSQRVDHDWVTKLVSSPTLTFWFFDSSCCNGSKLILLWSFDFHFLNDEWCWASFHTFSVYLYIFFGERCI